MSKPFFSISKFENWIIQQGGEILPCTNDYELIRFKGKQTGIIYKSNKVGNIYTARTLGNFLKGEKWGGQPISTGRENSYRKYKLRLIERDGRACFYCGKLMNTDISLEHLIPLTAGGQNNLANMVLAHEKCNQKYGALPISKKVSCAIKYRVEALTKILK